MSILDQMHSLRMMISVKIIQNLQLRFSAFMRKLLKPLFMHVSQPCSCKVAEIHDRRKTRIFHKRRTVTFYKNYSLLNSVYNLRYSSPSS